MSDELVDKGQKKKKDRKEKVLDLKYTKALLHTVEQIGERLYWVRSSESGRAYSVTVKQGAMQCDCPVGVHRDGRVMCSHMIAATVAYAKAQGLQPVWLVPSYMAASEMARNEGIKKMQLSEDEVLLVAQAQPAGPEDDLKNELNKLNHYIGGG